MGYGGVGEGGGGEMVGGRGGQRPVPALPAPTAENAADRVSWRCVEEQSRNWGSNFSRSRLISITAKSVMM